MERLLDIEIDREDEHDDERSRIDDKRASAAYGTRKCKTEELPHRTRPLARKAQEVRCRSHCGAEEDGRDEEECGRQRKSAPLFIGETEKGQRPRTEKDRIEHCCVSDRFIDEEIR